MDLKHETDKNFLGWFTLILIITSLWVFKSYFDYLIVAAVLSLATSHMFTGLTTVFTSKSAKGLLFKYREMIAATILTGLFLFLIFGPLLFFISATYEQINNLDPEHVKQTMVEMVEKSIIAYGSVEMGRLEKGFVLFNYIYPPQSSTRTISRE